MSAGTCTICGQHRGWRGRTGACLPCLRPPAVAAAAAVEPDQPTGRELRDEGSAAALAASDTVLGWKDRANAALVQLAKAGQPFTADDLVAAVGVPPHHNALGGLFLHASRRKVIRKTGEYRQGTRRAQHARAVPVWSGVPS